MKRIFGILVLLLFLQPQISNSLVWLNFLAHQEAIATELCIEREIEENTCQGNCQLAKQLVELPQSESNSSDEVTYIPQLELFYTAIQQNAFGIDLLKRTNYSHKTLYTYLFVFTIDQPPRQNA